MAGKSTISITFRLDGDGKGFKDLANDAEGLKKVITSTISEAQQLNTEAINFASVATGISQMQESLTTLRDCLTDLTAGYNYAVEAETKLTTVMGQRMNATQREIESIKELALAEREKGVIDDDVQLMGAQQIATFLSEAKSIETLLPAMNNLLAQQKGYAATGQDAVAIGNLMGKVMQGQVSALTRVGITFSEAEEKVLKFGTESERAAMLAQVITNNVGQMNAQLGATDVGKQVQLEAKLGDIQDRLGELLGGALPFVNMATEAARALASITILIVGIKKGTTAIAAFNIKGKAAASVTLLMGVNAKKSAAVMRVFNSAVKTGTYSVTAFKLALRGLMISTGIGLAIVAVTTAIEAFSNAADEAAEKEKALADEMNNFKKEVRDIGRVTGENSQKEIAELDKLYNVAKDDTRSRKERAAAISDLQSKYPAYFSNLSSEIINVKDLTAGYDNLRDAIIEAAKARAAETKIEENTGTLIDVERQITAKQEQIAALEAAYNRAKSNYEAGQQEDRTKRDSRNWFVSAMMSAEKVQPITVSEDKMRTASQEMTKYSSQLSSAREELSLLLQKQTELNAANQELAAIIKNTPTTGGATTPNVASPVWDDNAGTLKAITGNIQILTDKLQTASVEEAALINQQIAHWKAKADAIENAGKAAENNTPLWKEDAATLQDITGNIQILTDKLQTASVEEAALINQQIAHWKAKADAIENAGKASQNNAPVWKAEASTLKDISTNIQILNSQLETATIEEAALINQQIAAWNAKADAIRNAGKEAEKTGQSTANSLIQGWGAIKGMASSVESITEALKGNGNAWQVVVGIVDGFIGLYEGIQTIIGIINLLTAASAAHAATKGVEAAAETTEATTRATTAATNAAASAATITANKLEAASWKELAAAEYMAAHAYIPFAGFGIAMGFTVAMMAAVTAAGIPMLADGGIASGPTLAMVGEYAGASGNPEVIAPLDKLRGMLAGPTTLDFGNVKFEIEGRKLVAILAKENEHKKRG